MFLTAIYRAMSFRKRNMVMEALAQVCFDFVYVIANYRACRFILSSSNDPDQLGLMFPWTSQCTSLAVIREVLDREGPRCHCAQCRSIWTNISETLQLRSGTWVDSPTEAKSNDNSTYPSILRGGGRAADVIREARTTWEKAWMMDWYELVLNLIFSVASKWHEACWVS